MPKRPKDIAVPTGLGADPNSRLESNKIYPSPERIRTTFWDVVVCSTYIGGGVLTTEIGGAYLAARGMATCVPLLLSDIMVSDDKANAEIHQAMILTDPFAKFLFFGAYFFGKERDAIKAAEIGALVSDIYHLGSEAFGNKSPSPLLVPQALKVEDDIANVLSEMPSDASQPSNLPGDLEAHQKDGNDGDSIEYGDPYTDTTPYMPGKPGESETATYDA